MRLLVQFRKTGTAAYISHLDLMRSMQRAMRRAQIPMRYSQGFNPHPLLAFAMASPVGMSSHAEYMDVRVEDWADLETMTAALRRSLPDGIAIVRTRLAEDGYPTLMSRVAVCEAVLDFPNAEDLGPLWERFMQQDEIVIDKHSKKGMRKVDIRPMILESRRESESEIAVRVKAGSAENLNPVLLAEAFCSFAGIAPVFYCLQRALWGGNTEELRDLFDLDGEDK